MLKTITKSIEKVLGSESQTNPSADGSPQDKPARADLSAGMGAILGENGVTFRVWAPHAKALFVTGTFNDWQPDADKLDAEENGYWAGRVADAEAGDEYKFVIKSGEHTLQRIDPYARQVTNSVGNGVVLDPNFDWGADDFQAPAWNEMVIYEMHVGTFNDEPGGDPGNLQSAAEKLPYLRDLGINAIEVMPTQEFPGGFSWGYNPSHIFAVESDYGGPEAFKRFIKAAHEHGMAVILDVVYNHFGPSDLDLWQFDGWSQNDGGGIYFYNDSRAETPWGATRPDYGRPEVRQFIRDNALMWLNEYRIDGLRWDATAYIRNVFGNDGDEGSDLAEGWELMGWVNDEVQTHAPGTLTIAEDLRDNMYLTKTTSDGGAGFGAQWNAQFVHTLRDIIITPMDEQRDMNALAATIHHRDNDDFTDSVIYTESHDEVANGSARVPEEIEPSQADSIYAKKRATLGTAFVLTAPGIPMLFQGQEFLESGWFRDQVPLDWSKAERFAGLVQLHRDLIALRRNRDGVSGGLLAQRTDVYHINNEGKVLVYHRWGEGEAENSVVVVANFSSQQLDNYRIGLPQEGTWHVRFNSDSKRYNEAFSDVGVAQVEAEAQEYDGQEWSGTVNLAPYTALILSQ